MNEIGSFNELFFEAANAGLLLQQFHQLPNGRWVACWRRGSGPGATHYPHAEHERPFDVLLKAFIVAFGAMTVKTNVRQLSSLACLPETERNCPQPWHWDDGVPYCDVCGVFRQSKTGATAETIDLFA